MFIGEIRNNNISPSHHSPPSTYVAAASRSLHDAARRSSRPCSRLRCARGCCCQLWTTTQSYDTHIGLCKTPDTQRAPDFQSLSCQLSSVPAPQQHKMAASGSGARGAAVAEEPPHSFICVITQGDFIHSCGKTYLSLLNSLMPHLFTYQRLIVFEHAAIIHPATSSFALLLKMTSFILGASTETHSLLCSLMPHLFTYHYFCL